MKLVGWNCRGLGNGPAVQGLLEVGRTEDPDIIFLSETKLTEKELEKFKWKLGLCNMVARSSEGRSRGLALFWRRGVNISLRSYGRRHIDVDVTEDDGTLWRLTGMYGESEMERKIETWRTIRLLGQQHEAGRPWMCYGDFNEVLVDDEKIGGGRRPQAYMDRFRDSLVHAGLCDIGYTGDKFTWRNHNKEIHSYICERLDRVTANAEWCGKFPGFSVVHERPRHSDHRPLVINTMGDAGRSGGGGGDRGFRFEAWWLQEEGCAEVIQEAWEEGKAEGCSVAQSMRKVACRMRRWHKEEIGELAGRLKRAQTDLERCMCAPVSEAKIREEGRLRGVVNDLEEKKNTRAKQRSHVAWLKDGNRNTRYFMAVASARRKKNRIKGLVKEDGTVVKEGNDLTNYVCSYFQGLFTSSMSGRLADLLDTVPARVTNDMNNIMSADFTCEEVKAALDHIGDLKAPGPDGMPSVVYKRNWPLMGDQVVEEVLAVLNGGEIPAGWNDTVIVLIPKVKSPSRIKDLRPISLCNVLYKLVSKVIANRMKLILPQIISDNQSAFIPGRLITDNVLISYEISDYILHKTKGKEGYAAVKADMSKAYDRVEWSYLDAMLRRLGF
uniref:Reverse transcriptase domain-containing protein n=1 Tax=Hordeum vulgare subsp. vulgare TaxID=112509 RepID=A0A8I6XHE9_HORVV